MKVTELKTSNSHAMLSFFVTTSDAVSEPVSIPFYLVRRNEKKFVRLVRITDGINVRAKLPNAARINKIKPSKILLMAEMELFKV